MSVAAYMLVIDADYAVETVEADQQLGYGLKQGRMVELKQICTR
jgi:hypothetical protein